MNCIFEFLQRRICCESGTVSDGRVGAEGVGDDHVGVEARESRLGSRECLLPTRSVATPDLFASPSLASPTPNSFPIAASARRTHSQQPIKPSQRPSRRQLPPLGVSLVDIRVNSAVNRSQPPVSPTASICMQPAQRGERDSGDPLVILQLRLDASRRCRALTGDPGRVASSSRSPRIPRLPYTHRTSMSLAVELHMSRCIFRHGACSPLG
ncbi:hypothetical protein VFPFJ_09248 [Purpureocillium lilacinum]|uniref:Uncharacterized protein n=1 Tax=Purpureocillium lilacinum TaxID=33203 RepID=A0A179GSC3_PURLI|nr:hypothetical protein VFPFJ_09248 [Purpureocillium lilacinum]OAQ80794.1 hypothetical protein VFPFJ_09248 [Purpureocillium lilacinum]